LDYVAVAIDEELGEIPSHIGEFQNFGIGAGFLTAKLVTRKTQHLKALLGIIIM
jgi:hypothetical protein